METPDVIVWGKNNGEGMVTRYRTNRGTGVFGLAMPNIYTSTDWDLGPTWCYLVLGQKNTLIDTGRFGNLEYFQTLLKSIGKKITDIDRVIPTHCHEDHDGNLAEIISSSGAELWAHPIYGRMISYHPDILDGAIHPELPGSCRLCVMPGEFYKTCLPYHKKRSLLNIDFFIEDGKVLPDDDLSFIYTPGHCPDSVCTILEEEIIFPGDTLLHDITPHPSRVYAFEVNRRILPEGYNTENTIYGLMVYIRSLNKIASNVSQPFKATFPAHRLYYGGQFNLIHSSADRAKEIIQFHIDRCSDILRIVDGKPTGIDDIAIQHFEPELLEGVGKFAARNELTAHIEVMENCGDVRWVDGKRDMVISTGSKYYLDFMGAYLQ
jgi:glyoxylase-like metal-dependent hydrolase (beta-lactamase superfamily II)